MRVGIDAMGGDRAPAEPVDGALAARFTRWVAQALEDPVLLALEG